MQGGEGEPRDLDRELEKGFDTAEMKASGCGSKVEGRDLSKKWARGVVIIGHQF